MRFLTALFAVCMWLSTSVYAEHIDKTKQDSVLNSYNEKLEQLQKTVQELESTIKQKEQQDELEKLLEEANKLTSVEKKEEHNIGKKFHTGVRQQSAMNPNISMSGDFFGGFSSKQNDYIKSPSDFRYGTNGFYLREAEISLVAPLDPFTRGKTFISVTEEEIAIEEAYLQWLNLPANMNLKMGLFNAEFGILNRYHDHALPQFDRPRVLTNLFTAGNMGGFGLGGNFLLKPLFFSQASILDVTVMSGGTGQSFTNEGDLNLVYVANFTNFYDITQSTFFEWRLGGMAGYNDAAETQHSYVGNLAFNLKWIPVDKAKYRTIDWKTELLYSRRETPDGNVNSKGFYTSLQNKLNARWWISARLDYSQLPYNTSQDEWAYTAAADLWQSDFVFIRFQYQYSDRNFGDSTLYPDDHSFICQVNWAMGPHKHEAY